MIKEFLNSCIRPRPQDVERRILHLVQHAWEYVPFYRMRMAQAGISPADITCLQDYVNKFPITTPAEYRAYQSATNSLGLIDTRLDKAILHEDRSSGSSGAFMSIHRTPQEIEVNKGRSLWYLTRAGLRPWHRVLAVLHPSRMEKHSSFLQSLGIFHRTTVDYTTPVEEIAKIIDREKINVIYGQKSYLRLIADYYYDRKIPGPRLQLLIPGAERISPADRKLFQNVFDPVRFREFYGASETYFIASKHEGDYEPDYKAVFFSLADPAPSGELVKGSIVATSLVNKAQPILGLELGDRIVVRNYDKLYELGASIVELEGRNNDYLVLPSGQRLSCATFCVILDSYPFVRQFRILQDDIDTCTVQLKISASTPEEQKRMENALVSVIVGKIQYEIEYVDDIPLDKNGKSKVLSSRIDRC